MSQRRLLPKWWKQDDLDDSVFHQLGYSNHTPQTRISSNDSFERESPNVFSPTKADQPKKSLKAMSDEYKALMMKCREDLEVLKDRKDLFIEGLSMESPKWAFFKPFESAEKVYKKY